MNVYWSSWALLTLCLPGAAEPPSSQSCTGGKVLVQVAVNATVSVPCPDLTGDEIFFRLYKDHRMVDTALYLRKNHAGKTVFTLKEGRSLRVSQSNGTVSFELSGVTGEDSGSYSCDMLVSLPPPAIRAGNRTNVLVFVKGSCEPLSVTAGPTGPCGGQGQGCRTGEVADPSTLNWGWSLGLGTAITYGLVVTVIALVIWLKLRGVESSLNDYENTRPGTPPRCKRRPGVQQPPLPRWIS